MPLFQQSTNLSQSDIPAPFHKDLTKMLGQLLQKNPNVSELSSTVLPRYACSERDLLQHNSVCISNHQFLTCAGTTENGAFDNFASIGNIAGKDHDAYVEAMPEFQHEKLRIDKSRFTPFPTDYPANEGGSHGLTSERLRRRLQPAPAG